MAARNGNQHRVRRECSGDREQLCHAQIRKFRRGSKSKNCRRWSSTNLPRATDRSSLQRKIQNLLSMPVKFTAGKASPCLMPMARTPCHRVLSACIMDAKVSRKSRGRFWAALAQTRRFRVMTGNAIKNWPSAAGGDILLVLAMLTGQYYMQLPLVANFGDGAIRRPSAEPWCPTTTIKAPRRLRLLLGLADKGVQGMSGLG